MKMYLAALIIYFSAANSTDIFWFAPVLGNFFMMGETAVITLPPDAEEEESEKMTEDRTIKKCN